MQTETRICMSNVSRAMKLKLYTRTQFYYTLTRIMFFIIHVTDHKLIFDFIAFHKFFPPGRANHLHTSDGIQN